MQRAATREGSVDAGKQASLSLEALAGYGWLVRLVRLVRVGACMAIVWAVAAARMNECTAPSPLHLLSSAPSLENGWRLPA